MPHHCRDTREDRASGVVAQSLANEDRRRALGDVEEHHQNANAHTQASGDIGRANLATPELAHVHALEQPACQQPKGDRADEVPEQHRCPKR